MTVLHDNFLITLLSSRDCLQHKKIQHDIKLSFNIKNDRGYRMLIFS